MKNNLDTPVAKQCRALYTKYRIQTYVRPIKSWPLWSAMSAWGG